MPDVQCGGIAESIQHFLEDGIDQRIEPRIVRVVGVGAGRVFGQIDVLIVAKQPLGMTERLEQRGELHIVVVGYLFKFLDLFFGGSPALVNVFGGNPFHILAFGHQPVDAERSKQVFDHCAGHFYRVLVQQQMDAATSKSRGVGYGELRDGAVFHAVPEQLERMKSAARGGR
ncbi:hypothetical protein SDC9_198684 [bioreactor metagenome]|uniref:Uncharacterized protein n=1 Tax=bioreactor metagenome TaxID=1076179 RepID=A0A645IV41_9ZZZZ